MSTSRRARLAVLLHGGTYLLAAAHVLGVAVVTLAGLAALPGAVAARIGAPLCIATVGAAGYATWQALRGRHGEPPGVAVTRMDAPELWAVLDACAAAVGVRPPDTVTVVADVTVAVHQRVRLLGLLGGRRDLHLGLPVLQALDVGHLRALLAHELAHDRTDDGRWIPVAYRGRLALGRTVARIGPRNPVGGVFRAYARLSRRVDGPVVRSHEFTADQVAVRVAGRGNTMQALVDLPLLAAAQRLFLADYLGPGWQAGYVPDDIFGGFLRVLAARADQLRAAADGSAAAPAWDPHPPLAERLAALAAPSRTDPVDTAVPPVGTAVPPVDTAVPVVVGQPIGSDGPAATGEPAGVGDAIDDAESALLPANRAGEPGQPADSQAAGALVPDLPGLGRALQGIVFPPQGRRTVDWDTFFTAARDAEMQREVDGALRALSKVAETPLTGAGDVLDLAAQGGLGAATRSVFPELTEEQAGQRAAALVELLLAVAARRCEVARWRHSWTGAAELVATDGTGLDLGELAALASTEDGSGEARKRLAELGVDLATVRADRSAAPSGVLAGLVNLTVDGARADLLLLDDGLLVVPGLPRSRAGTAKRRLAQLAAADPADWSAAVPDLRLVPYEEITAALQTRRAPRTWQLTLRGGGVCAIRVGVDSDELPGGWAALDDAISFLAARD